jgi:Holliday junction resolvase RusA-like endonuclease
VNRVSLTAYGVAAPAGSKTLSRVNGRTWLRDSSRRGYAWRRDVAQAAGLAMRGRPLLDGALAFHVTFYVPRPKTHYGRRGLRPSALPFPTTRPDATKLLRAVEDALTGVVWRDDAQVVEHTSESSTASQHVANCASRRCESEASVLRERAGAHAAR